MKTKLRIHKWPEKILKKRSKRVKEVDSDIRHILDEMHVLMKANDGVGLASNQVGLGIRLLVIELGDKTFKLVNPRITRREGKLTFKEGCLSFPGLELIIKRSKKVGIEALDRNGKHVYLEPEGVLAVVFQHEIDHLNGVTFIERISPWQRLKIASRLRKIKKETLNELSK